MICPYQRMKIPGIEIWASLLLSLSCLPLSDSPPLFLSAPSLSMSPEPGEHPELGTWPSDTFSLLTHLQPLGRCSPAHFWS